MSLQDQLFWLFGLFLSTFIYLVVVGVFYSVVFVVVVVACALIYRDIVAVTRVTSRVALFLVLLLLFGAVGEIIWTSLVAGRLYISSDYMFGYLPFWPITQSEIDEEFAGHPGALLNGTSLTTVNVVWTVITAGVWGASIFTYSAICANKSNGFQS